MATTLPKINLTDLDFDDIKTSLKVYLQSQTEFQDFDFEGAAINILMDLLAQNTYYAAFFANMVINEAFLDTAIKRDSVVSHAKALSFTPHSIRAAKAVVDITIRPNNDDLPSAISIPRNLQFKAAISTGTVYSFVTTDTQIVKKSATNTYVARGVELVEGALVQFAYEYDPENSDQKLLIPNANADVTTLTVRVRESTTDSTTSVYLLASDLTKIESTSKVFWLQESNSGFFEIYFGDGIIGKKPAAGNIIILEYIITNGELANGLGSTASPITYLGGAASYNINNVASDTTQFSVSTVSIASGGAEKQTLDSIRFAAPKSYSAQNRAVTTNDYTLLINQNYPSIEAIAVWGGEDNIPVDLGSVYISLKPYAGTEVTESMEDDIIATLKKYNVVTIVPKIVDPDYTYLKVVTEFTFDPTLSTLSAADLETIVFNTIRNYGDNTLEKFSKNFRISRLTTLIDNADTAILGNQTFVLIAKHIEPTLNTNYATTLSFNNDITAIASSAFTYGGKTAYMDADTTTNKIRVYELINNVKTVLSADIGDIDFATGVLTITALNVSAYVGDYIEVEAVPVDQDVETARNQILIISADDIDVTSQSETD